jgi:outer membrane lipoprotein-sorting protein
MRVSRFWWRVAGSGVLMLLAVGAPARAQSGDARDLVKRGLEALPRVPFVAKLKLTVSQGPVREMVLSHKVVGAARASYLEVTSPVDLQGMRFLFLERSQGASEQFIKVAAARKAVQVADEVRKHPFLGSTFYIADLVEPEVDASTYSYVGEEEILGRRCKLVESTPKKPESAIYAKTIIAVDPKDLLILKRLFLGEGGKTLKAWTVEKVEKVDGFWTILDQRMKNVQDQSESRLEVIEVKYNLDLPDSTFTEKHLVR